MKTRHTPGPWRFVADGAMDDDCNTPRVPVPFDFTGPGYYNNPGIEGPGGETVVGCGEYLVFGPNFDCNEGTRAANVALMCAAPELLAALEMLVGTNPLHSLCRHEGEDALGRVKGAWSAAAEQAARAAIQKATQAP